MLALTRRIGESLIIDGNIKVKLLSMGGGRVKLGIEAPQNITIDREEVILHQRQKKESEKKVNIRCTG